MIEDLFKKDKKVLVIGVLAVLCIGGAVATYFRLSNNPTIGIEEQLSPVQNTPTLDTSIADISIYVDMNGEVRKPGVYKLKSGNRVIQAIRAAGGLTSFAATDSINFAEKLKDGQKITVKSRLVAASATDASSSKMVNINTADIAALDSLPGIGPAMAKKIVDRREANGSFQTIDDLKSVPGIGKSKFESLKSRISVN